MADKKTHRPLSMSSIRDPDDNEDSASEEASSASESSSSSEHLGCKADANTRSDRNDRGDGDGDDDDDLLVSLLGTETKAALTAVITEMATEAYESRRGSSREDADVNALARDLSANTIDTHDDNDEPIPTPLVVAARRYSHQGLILSVDNPDGRGAGRSDACERVVLDLLRKATQSIHLYMYSFNSFTIMHELIRCAGRGVDVTVVLDSKQALEQKKYADAKNAKSSSRSPMPCIHEALLEAGCAVVLRGGCDRNERSSSNYKSQMHLKALFLDYSVIVSGSYNYTLSARDQNFEHINVQVVSTAVAVANITALGEAHLLNPKSIVSPKKQ